jgi:hypothetical protein
MICLAGLGAHAQQATTVPGTSATTRAQVKIEREEFIKSHRWDPVIDDWALKPGYEPPVGVKDRAQVREERNEFLKNNRWDPVTDDWVPLSKPRVITRLSRDQVKRETREFLRTHEWDVANEVWMDKRKRR